MKQLLGVLLKDLPRYIPALVQSGKAWLTVCNRAQRLEEGRLGFM